jgi:hypothetical protein
VKSLVAILVGTLLLACSAPAARAAVDPSLAKAQADAKAELVKDQVALKVLKEKAQQEYENGEDYKAALAAVQQAQADVKAATTPVLEQLHAKPEYKAAAEKKFKANEEYEALSKAKGVTREQITAASNALIVASSELTGMEAAALAAAPAVAEAKAKLTAANEELKKVRLKFEETLKENAEYQAALKLVEEDKQKVEMARKALADATAAAIADRAKNRPAPQPRSTPAPSAGKKY